MPTGYKTKLVQFPYPLISAIIVINTNAHMRKHFTLLLLLAFSTLLHAQKFPNMAPTPPMGFNSWNFFYCNVDEEKICKMADAMVSNGMKQAGYSYLVIDDCWQIARDKAGYILADSVKFPHGIKWLADYVHAKGLKFGIYSCGGTRTCAGRPGSAGYERQDAERYAEWKVDYLKFDWCNSKGLITIKEYPKMRDALYKAGHPIVFSICEWGVTLPWLWAAKVGQLWRTTGDIEDKYATGHGVLKIFYQQSRIRRYNKPNRWNDPDMLEVGNKGLSITESRSHFTLWCMLAAPLMAGNNLAAMDKDILAILTNKTAIAVDQDKLGLQCFKWRKTKNGLEAWLKPLADGSYALCFINRGDTTLPLNFKCPQTAYDFAFHKKYTIGGGYTVYDVWNNKELGTTANNIAAAINSHDVLFVILKKK